ncbi:MAG TPA: Hsp20/alpha crystallin family protein [Thermodesulfobacteriota bacterium]|nr:Hsp20/alpha crystallin family protein [Thermodesulfobacteriota bacterium]
MEIVRWNPWGEFNSLEKRVNRMFDETLRNLYPTERKEPQAGSWTPAADIYETESGYVVKADFPGVKKEDIQIDVHDGTLTLKAEKKFEKKESKDNYLRVERAYGSFVRSFRLPKNVDAEKIKAEYKDGVLEVTLPKKEEAKPKKIQVN